MRRIQESLSAALIAIAMIGVVAWAQQPPKGKPNTTQPGLGGTGLRLGNQSVAVCRQEQAIFFLALQRWALLHRTARRILHSPIPSHTARQWRRLPVREPRWVWAGTRL